MSSFGTPEPSYLEDYDLHDVPDFATLDELDRQAREKLLEEGFIICLNDGPNEKLVCCASFAIVSLRCNG